MGFDEDPPDIRNTNGNYTDWLFALKVYYEKVLWAIKTDYEDIAANAALPAAIRNAAAARATRIGAAILSKKEP